MQSALAGAYDLVKVGMNLRRQRVSILRFWPKRLRSKPVPRRHRIEVSFGEPITATGDADAVMENVRSFFKNGAGAATPYRSLYRPRATVNGDH